MCSIDRRGRDTHEQPRRGAYLSETKGGLMAATLAAAIEAVEPELDRILQRSIRPPRPTPTDPRAAVAFVGFSYEVMRKIIGRVAARERASLADAEESVHGVFADLYAERPALFFGKPTSWQDLLYTLARYRVRDERRRGRRLTSMGSGLELVANTDDAPWAPSIQAEDARYSTLPAYGEEWTRTQVIGAFQRFADYRGRPPKARECKRINGLPSRGVVCRLFGSFSSALREAGMFSTTAGRRAQKWSAVQAAIVCRGFYRRHGYWPGSSDIGRYPGALPSTSVMKRFFGSTRPANVQSKAQAILRSHGLPVS